ncbi:MAG: hypothetical protein IJ187_09625 [Neisseriaceae bacterium]|nr:hypothetical protein [Neisseriaceae bacterium]
MDYESVNRYECSAKECMDIYPHPTHKDFTLWHLFNGAYWIINDTNEPGMERLPDNLEDPEKWFLEEFSGNLKDEVKALWKSQKAREEDNFAQVALTAAYKAIFRQLMWIDANKSLLCDDDHKFADMLKDELNAINKSILRNIQAA